MSAAITAAVVVAAGAAGAAAISADSARKASNKQADAIAEARRQGLSAAQIARLDVLETMDPAMIDYGRKLQQVESGLASGTVDIMQLLQESTGRANELLGQTGINVEQAIMGSAAGAQGIPRQQFDQQYSQFVQERRPQDYTYSDYNRMLSTLPEQDRRAAEAELSTARGQEGARAVLEKYGVSMRPAYEAAGATPGVTPGATTLGQAATVSPQGAPTNMGIPRGEESRYSIPAGGQAPIEMTRQADGSFAPTSTQPTSLGTTAQPQIGFAGANQALERGRALASREITGGEQRSLADIATSRDQALGYFQPYAEAGTGAINREAALSGALGPEAQQQAINEFIESPGQKFLRERQEQALLRNQAAIGGLGGGNVRTALQEQAMGIAATQQQQTLENLRSIAMRGQEVAGSQAGITTGAGENMANIRTAAAGNRANIEALSAQQLAALAERTGLSVAQLRQQLGLAQSGNVQSLGNQLSSLQGATLADIAALRERGASTELSLQQNIAQFLANIGVEAGSQAANFTAQQGSALAAGEYARGQAIGQGIQGLGNVAGSVIGGYSAPAQSTTPVTVMPQTGAWSSNQPIPQTYTGMGMAR